MDCGVEVEAGKNVTPGWKIQNNDTVKYDTRAFKAELLACNTNNIFDYVAKLAYHLRYFSIEL